MVAETPHLRVPWTLLQGENTEEMCEEARSGARFPVPDSHGALPVRARGHVGAVGADRTGLIPGVSE
jgi:hypothetical protein